MIDILLDSEKLTTWKHVWLIQLIDWLTDWLTDWLWLAGWLSYWLTDWLTDWLTMYVCIYLFMCVCLIIYNCIRFYIIFSQNSPSMFISPITISTSTPKCLSHYTPEILLLVCLNSRNLHFHHVIEDSPLCLVTGDHALLTPSCFRRFHRGASMV